MLPNARSYGAKNKYAALQKFARHALSIAHLQSSSAKSESGHTRPNRTDARHRSARNIMNVESASGLEGMVKGINDETLTPQQQLEISERLVAVYDSSSTGLTLTTAMDQVSFCMAFVDRAQSTSNCAPISDPEMFNHACNGSFHNEASGRTEERRNGCSLEGPQGRSWFGI